MAKIYKDELSQLGIWLDPAVVNELETLLKQIDNDELWKQGSLTHSISIKGDATSPDKLIQISASRIQKHGTNEHQLVLNGIEIGKGTFGTLDALSFSGLFASM